VVKLARAAGEREARWVERLTETPFGLSLSKPPREPDGASTGSARTEDVAAPPSPQGLRFVLPEGLQTLHSIVVPLRWGDMDAMGHINNTLYFRYMESCRLDWVFASGVSQRLDTQGPVIVNAFCNFLRQLEFPGDIRVTMALANIGRSSLDTFHRIERLDEPGVVCAEGGARMVWTDYAQRRSAPMPDWFRAKAMGAEPDQGITE
jgi:acyl-CoA thioester hydrolase